MKLAYFVHNLNDPAIARRLAMLADGGCTDVVMFGFRRGETPVTTIGDIPAVDLGRTKDGGFVGRIKSIAAASLALRQHGGWLADRSVFMGRNLEGMQLAALGRRRFAPSARLAYECLDVHRLMLKGPAAPALRALEGLFLKDADLLVVSSPSYTTEYFRRYFKELPPVALVENKVLASDVALSALSEVLPPRPPGPPWRIGWYGGLRCRASLMMLSRLATRLDGLIEVVARGAPSAREMPDFDEIVERTPNMNFLGRYDRATDLGRIYADVHFTWSIDHFEKGLNGEWALANRLYEGGCLGSVMLAERSVAMGRWLAERGIGVLFGEPLEDEIAAFFKSLDQPTFERLAAAAHAVEPSNHIADRSECEALVNALEGRAPVCGNAPAHVRRSNGDAMASATIRD